MTEWFSSLRGEGRTLRHVFVSREVVGRPGIIERVHDQPSCALCALITIAETAQRFQMGEATSADLFASMKVTK